MDGPELRNSRRWRRPLVCSAAALAAGLALQAGLLPAQTVERFYSRGLFPPLCTALASVARLAPVSLAESALAGLVLVTLAHLARGLVQLARRERPARAILAAGLRRTLLAVSAGYLWFWLAWGLNHAREPYATSAGLDLWPAQAAELAAAAEERLVRANELRAGLAEDEAGVLRSRLDRAAFAEAVAAAYARAGGEHELLAGPRPLLRFALGSRLLSAFGISGIWSPFTAEAHVNAEQPDAQRGFNACHEVAHSRGFAREDEANFLAWLVGAEAAEPELAYSAELFALRHLLGALGGVDFPARLELTRRLSPAVRRDWQAIDEFWQPATRLTETVRHVSERVNDTYLKSQGQALGTRSYGRMVDLLLATRRAEVSRRRPTARH